MKTGLLRRTLGPFLTGMVFLAPVILTIVLLQWVGGYIRAALGPDSLIGSGLSRGGQLIVGMSAPVLAFWAGLALVIVAIWGLGLFVQVRARAELQGGFDRLLGRVPLLGAVYRPLAQVVRMVGGKPGDELQGMAVVAVNFGDATQVLALLASPRIFDLGQGPRQLVLMPTAPVPVGGALIFVAVDRVTRVPDLRVEDLAKFYVSMGTLAPAGLSPGSAR